MKKPVLFLKAHVKAHTRVTKTGKVAQVRDYDTNELPHSPTDPKQRMDAMAARGQPHVHHDSPAGRQAIGPWHEGNPRIVTAKVGKAPAEWGKPPEGASEAISFNYGGGPVTVWAKRTRYGEMIWDPEMPGGAGWNGRTEAHHVAWRMHSARKGSD